MQDFQIMSNQKLKASSTAKWMGNCPQIPMRQWLQPERHTASDQARLKCVGNIVVPHMANFAVQVLGQLSRGL